MSGGLRFFVLISVLLCVGCGQSSLPDSEVKPEAGKPSEEVIAPSDQEEEIDFPIGLYVKNGSGRRILQHQLQTEYTVGKDLVVLSAFLTEEPEISGSGFAEVWLSYQNELQEAAICKIGYRLSYNLASGEHIEQTIKGTSGYRTKQGISRNLYL